jgi:hypothetical protein
MNPRRDDFQRKCAAIRRMTMAMTRLSTVTCITDREQAGRWVAAWGAIAGMRQFKLERPGKRRAPRPWRFGPACP